MSHSEPRLSQPVAALVSILCPVDVQASEQLYPYPWLGLGSALGHKQLQAGCWAYP